MMTQNNFQLLLSHLGFRRLSHQNIYAKTINGVELKVDFDRQALIYPEQQGFTVNERQTCHFSAPENFVVFECVHRLLEKGYQPQHIELEKRWALGHSQKSGRADISVFLDDAKTQLFMIIECKTAGAEYNKALKILKEDGGQLFSYWQQEKSTQCLALYASDFDGSEYSFKTANIRCKDDANLIELHKKDSSLKLYQHAKNVEELHEVWCETYTQKFDEHLIFGDNAKAYNLDIEPLKIKDLKEFSPDDKIINQFEEILRHNAVSDKENAFNRLIALFICKLVDEEKDENAVVDFQYKIGEDTYEKLQDRLQNLYRIGMEKFMQEEIFYVESDYVEKLFKDLNIETRENSKNDLNETIRKLKYYTNNDFSFKDVHNEELFLQNGKILVEMVQLFEKYRISYGAKHQFLGDMFEQLLNKGFKQNEGQFFTPSPITRFIWDCLPVSQMLERNGGDYPKVIDYACGAGHFLTEAVEAINASKPSTNNDWTRDSIFGIEKDYRLARVSQVSMFMNGAGQSNIIFGDGLDNRPEQGIKNEHFDILVANPPYSVSAFKSHLKLKNNKLNLLNNISNNGGEIEVLFCERIVQLLKSGGVGAVILPSSILSNDSSSYTIAREWLLNEFRFRALVNLGSKTFGATGTNTVILFLEKMSYPPKQSRLALDQGQAVFKEMPLSQRKDQEVLNAYLAHIGVQPEIYDKIRTKSFTWSQLLAEQNEYISAQRNAILDKISLTKTEEKQPENEKQAIKLSKFFAEFHRVESEKIALFALLYQQQTLIINAPSDNAKQKEFLGYDWSNRKGAEGIQIQKAGGKLYDHTNRMAENTLAACVRAMFCQRTPDIGAAQQEYAYVMNSVDMIDFSAVNFNKAIRSSLKSAVQVTSKFPIVLLSDFPADIRKGKAITAKNAIEGNYKVVAGGKDFAYTHNQFNRDENTITISASGANAGFVNFWAEKIFASDCTTVRTENDISTKYIFAYLQSVQEQLYDLSRGAAQPHVYPDDIKQFKIPKPPLEIQKEIVEKCDEIDNACEVNAANITKLREEIENVINVINGKRYKLGEICLINAHSTNPSEWGSKELIYIDIDAVENGTGNYRLDKMITADNAPSRARRLAKSGSTVISTVRPNLKGFAFIETELQNTVYSTGFAILESKNQNILLNKILYWLFMYSSDLMKQMEIAMPKGQYPSINKTDIENLEIMLPDLATQRQIVEKIQSLEKEIAELSQQMSGAHDAKKAILAAYL